MADDNREATSDTGYELAGAIRFGYEQRRWVLAGGDDDDSTVTLRVILQGPDSEELVKRYEIVVPIRVDGDDLVVGEPEVRRA